MLLDCGSSIPLLRRRDTSSDRRRLRNNTLRSAVLYLLTVYARCKSSVISTRTDFVTVFVVDIFDVKGMDVAGEVSVKRKYVATLKRYQRS